MRIIPFDGAAEQPLALALGFFDCLHLGHRRLIQSAVRGAAERGIRSAVFTFSDNPYAAFGSQREEILTFSERCEKLNLLGCDYVLAMSMSGLQKEMSAREFFRQLTQNKSIDRIYCGGDYTFGAGAEGNAELLSRLCGEAGIACEIIEFVRGGKEKISTSQIRRLLQEGDAQAAEKLLGEPFCIGGEVVRGYEIGRTIGFPTANLVYPQGKVRLKEGVYLTDVLWKDKRYPGITNVGGRPTFADGEFKAETYIHGFDGDLYHERITVRFLKFLRDIKRFSSAAELKAQIEKDKEVLLNGWN